MTTTHVPSRFPEIDLARGVAVIMMVVFHTAFDLAYLGIVPLPVGEGGLRLLALATAALFLFLVGISLSISSAHAREVLSYRDFVLKYLRRGFLVLLLGLGITVVTWLILPGGYIIFGILHLIGLAILLSPLYTGRYWANLFLGAAIVALGPLVAGLQGSPLLLWVGVQPSSFYSVDYTPVFPWLGVVLLGVFFGMTVYPSGKRPTTFRTITFRPLQFLGRHSLAVYLIHQPVIISVLLLLFPGSSPFSLPGLPV
jgi:uncharacterized membrane protein